MSSKNWIVVVSVLIVVSVAVIILQYRKSADWFVEYPIPLKETYRLFDIGIVDVNGDNHLDIYTSNHHFRQALLVADGRGGYRDALSEWGLDQSREFPLAELTFEAPVIDKPGLYIYWLGTDFFIVAHKTQETGQWKGTLRVNDPVKIMKKDGFQVQKQDQVSDVSETVIEFSTSKDGKLGMRPGGQGLPISFHISGDAPLSQIYVGRGKVSPVSNSFALTMQDRHSMAWADYNDDGLLDVFTPRGALSGMLRKYPEAIVRRVTDELLVSQQSGKYADIASAAGIEKRGCSGRHSRWLDFNQDGLLDLYVNCYDREHVMGDYPKQLYQQDERGLFKDVASTVGLGMPDQQIGSFSWIDVDNDGDLDLVTYQDEGFFLYRNQAGSFSGETIYERPSTADQRIAETKGIRWFFDGKLTAADFDADGDLDLFSASQRGNLLLKNEGGRFVAVEPKSIGLPESSMTANWVDYDNDGMPDLHTVPQGLFRQTKEQDFEPTALLAFPEEQYRTAICNWYDLDNDGYLDVLMALQQDTSFKHWWELSPEKKPHQNWSLKTYRNVGTENHWLQIKLNGGKGNRQAIGARVTVVTPDGQQVQEVGSTDGAFFSQGHYRLYFGLGSHARADAVKIRWPEGQQQELKDVAGDKLLVIDKEDTGAGS